MCPSRLCSEQFWPDGRRNCAFRSLAIAATHAMMRMTVRHPALWGEHSAEHDGGFAGSTSHMNAEASPNASRSTTVYAAA